MINDQDQLNILLKIDKEKNTSQRQLASNLGFSLGKLNYLLNELIKKGLIKIKRFKKNENKLRYAYIITPEGISKRSKFALNFMKRKMAEYEELKNEISKLKKRKNNSTKFYLWGGRTRFKHLSRNKNERKHELFGNQGRYK